VVAPLVVVLFAFVRVNIVLGVFNLIPLPPLDGGHFLPYFLPPGSWPLLRTLEQYGPILLIVLVISGATRYVMGPLIQLVSGIYIGVLRLIF
jgi:Zn-dependent protease